MPKKSPRSKRPARPAKPLKAGRVHYLQPIVFPLPKRGQVARYVVTAAQNNTPVHSGFWANLLAFSKAVGARLMVSRFTYDKTRFRSTKSLKNGPAAGDRDSCWYDPAIAPYVCDAGARQRYQLAPSLFFCAEMNILPTATRPLSGLDAYTGQASAIFPHAKLALESIPTGNHEPTKFNYTTGACTQRNYIQKKEGLKAEFHHAYSALVVEVVSDGRWWVRQLNADLDGTFQDLGVRVKRGRVSRGRRVLGITWGDVHASEIDPHVARMNWGEAGAGGIIDALRPAYQFDHDLFSWRCQNHHEQHNFGARLRTWSSGWSDVEREIRETAAVLDRQHRPWCQTVVVNSNHDDHGEKWLEWADYRDDLPNAEIFLEAQLARVRAIKAGEPWAFLPWAMTWKVSMPEARGARAAKFLGTDEPFVLAGVEHGWHGHRGPNGARGSTANLVRTCRKITKGHDHTATIRDGVTSTGVCQTRMPYAKGPSSWSVTHCLQYEHGKRALITMSGGEPWAGFSG